MATDARRAGNAVDAERAPIVARRVPCHQVPALGRVRHTLGFDMPAAGLATDVGVAELDQKLVTTGGGQRGE
ncbi:hypothetical protein G6F57_023849 [Rhizopus arrhizus]|nr:hypothetical protein G6F57_023849 [Rhizopus arrhizus]